MNPRAALSAHRLLAVAFLATGVVGHTAESAGGEKSTGVAASAQSSGGSKSGAERSTEAKNAAGSAAKERLRKGGSSTGDLKKYIDQLREQRDTLIADHDGLVKAMKDATEEQKKAIMERIEKQKKAFEEATNALHKQIRDEQRKQRIEGIKR